jgi:endonuclease-3
MSVRGELRAKETPAGRRARARRVARALADAYPDAWCALRYEDAWQLLVATILSAQCTDACVNTVTPVLFRHYPTAAALAAAPVADIEALIHSTGFFRQKAKALKMVAESIARLGGEVPRDLETLVGLSGIGRKTANVVLGTAYGVPAIMVDTHVLRLAHRLDLTRQDDPTKVEMELSALLPPSEWTHFSHRLIHHGRQICGARRPRCAQCPLLRLCPQMDVPADAKRPVNRGAGSGRGHRLTGAGKQSSRLR